MTITPLSALWSGQRQPAFVPIVVPTDGTMVNPRPTGALVCSKCQPSWCRHIQYVVEHGLDDRSVWDHGFSLDPCLPNVSIPVMPSFSLWMSVKLTRVGDSTAVLKVYIHHPRPTEAEKLLGFIGEGEGRNILRQMVIEWFEPRLHGDPVACGNILHSVGRDVRQSEVVQDEAGKFANAWTLYHFGECIVCWSERAARNRSYAQASAGSSQTRFPPDLIPSM